MRNQSRSKPAGLPAALFVIQLVLATAAGAQHDAPQPRLEIEQQSLLQMLAPIALYPDPLLSQVLMAATYPLEIVEAAQWSRANPALVGDVAVTAVAQMDWDPSVKSLVAFPQILTVMEENIGWTHSLGDAFVSAQAHVMEAIQQLRERAYAAGNLALAPHLRVERHGPAIAIEAAQPQTIYVPYYDPFVVYGAWWLPAHPPMRWRPWHGYRVHYGSPRAFAWDRGTVIPAGFFSGGFDWHRRHARIVNAQNYYHHRPANAGRPSGPIHPRDANAAGSHWRHDPFHRRGIAYRDSTPRSQPQPAASVSNARADFAAPAHGHARDHDGGRRDARGPSQRPLERNVDGRSPAHDADTRGGARSDRRDARGHRSGDGVPNRSEMRASPAVAAASGEPRPMRSNTSERMWPRALQAASPDGTPAAARVNGAHGAAAQRTPALQPRFSAPAAR